MDDIQPSDNVRTRIATFELNSAKQASKIVQDTNAPGFEITEKDSSRNINISCISGFYLEVAKSTIIDLSQCQIEPVDGITDSCKTKTMDSIGHEFNLTLFFKLNLAYGKTLKVPLHTHHSFQTILG